MIGTVSTSFYGPLGDLLEHLIHKIDNDNIMPCPGCGENPAVDCGFGVHGPDGDFDCEAPDGPELTCEYCHHLYCEKCQEWEDLFKINGYLKQKRE